MGIHICKCRSFQSYEFLHVEPNECGESVTLDILSLLPSGLEEVAGSDEMSVIFTISAF
jgi:hypothetical protein